MTNDVKSESSKHYAETSNVRGHASCIMAVHKHSLLAAKKTGQELRQGSILAKNHMLVRSNFLWPQQGIPRIKNCTLRVDFILRMSHVTLWCRRVFVCSSFKLACTELSLNLYC